MSEHINGWLVAYHDGELGERRSKKVEAHLETCQTCREELEKLNSLKLLLQENPEADDLTSPDRFVAQVGLQLKPRPSWSAFQRTLSTMWLLVPVGMLCIWAFAQTLFSMVGWTEFVLDTGLLNDITSILTPNTNMGLSSSFFLQIGVSIIIGLISLSWLASWWISQIGDKSQEVTE